VKAACRVFYCIDPSADKANPTKHQTSGVVRVPLRYSICETGISCRSGEAWVRNREEPATRNPAPPNALPWEFFLTKPFKAFGSRRPRSARGEMTRENRRLPTHFTSLSTLSHMKATCCLVHQSFDLNCEMRACCPRGFPSCQEILA
jgi:hypothetical protein